MRRRLRVRERPLLRVRRVGREQDGFHGRGGVRGRRATGPPEAAPPRPARYGGRGRSAAVPPRRAIRPARPDPADGRGGRYHTSFRTWKRLGVADAGLDAADAREPTERLVVEPRLRPLRREVLAEQRPASAPASRRRARRRRSGGRGRRPTSAPRTRRSSRPGTSATRARRARGGPGARRPARCVRTRAGRTGSSRSRAHALTAPASTGKNPSWNAAVSTVAAAAPPRSAAAAARASASRAAPPEATAQVTWVWGRSARSRRTVPAAPISTSSAWAPRQRRRSGAAAVRPRSGGRSNTGYGVGCQVRRGRVGRAGAVRPGRGGLDDHVGAGHPAPARHPSATASTGPLERPVAGHPAPAPELPTGPSPPGACPPGAASP